MLRSSRAVSAPHLTVAALAILACSESPSFPSLGDRPDAGELTVSIAPKHDTVATGAIRQLTVRVTDAKGSPSTVQVDWTTDNSAVASVSTTGLLTAIAAGSARIIVRAGTSADTATIVVRAAAPMLIIDPDRVSIASGELLPLTVTPSAAVAASFTAGQVRWSTSDTSIATVSSEGIVTTLDAGSVTVTAVLGGASGTTALAVFKNPIASIQIDPTASVLTPGETMVLKAIARDAEGRKVPIRSLAWSTSDTGVADVSDNGQVKGKRKGFAIISARANDLRASATVNVLSQPIGTVAVQLSATSISVGQTAQATATLTAADGSTVTDRVIAWQSSNPSIITIDSRGVITGVAAGSATVSAISDGKIGSAGITVTASVPTSLTVAPATVSAVVGGTSPLVAELRDGNGLVITGKAVTWTSSNNAVASVNGSGLVTSLAIGTATISASSSGLTGTAAFTVTGVAVASVAVSPTENTLDVGQSVQLTATALGVNGATLVDRPVTWTSTNPGVATVSPAGLVSAIAPGSTTVTATVEGISASVPVSVRALPPAPIATISVSLNVPSVLVGQTTQAVAVVKDAAENVLQGRSVSWSTNDSTLATVSAAGIVTAIAAGSVTIVACAEGKFGAATLRIDPPAPAPVVSVVLTAPTTTLAPGASIQVSATLRDSAGRVLSGRTIAWSSSAAAIASVSATGLVTAVAAGTATIHATSEGVEGSLAITVTAPVLQPVAVATVSASMTPTSLTVGSTAQATATPRDAAGNTLSNRVVSWSSSNAAVASVSSSGLVSAMAAGSATVTATVEGKTGAVTATVTAPTPAPGTAINPGESIQAKVDANPAGTAFLLKAGVHRLQEVRPKSGNTFAGELGAVMSGARLLTSFVREGNYWVAIGQTQSGADRTDPTGVCRASRPRCIHPENLFINDTPLEHVASLAAVSPGRWYFDYAADKIYFADDPTGKKVETSVTRHAFVGTANDVTIRGLVIEKYANPPQQGAVSPGAYQQSGGTGWLIEDNEVRFNHGEGLRINTGARLLRNRVHHQGQLGIGSSGDRALVEGNEVFSNNFAGVDPNHAAGGIKVHGVSGNLSEDLVLRNNHVHDNDGHGVWCDFNCLRTVYEGNRIERNAGWGIFHEISYSAVVRNNTISGNGGGVFISTSQDVEVAFNTIAGPFAIYGLDQARGTGFFGTLILANLNAHDNVVTVAGSAASGQLGVIATTGTDAAFTARNNRFVNNRYTLSGVQRPFTWFNAYRTATEWLGYGFDLTGSISP